MGRYERVVYSIPLRYGLSREDAADISQLTFAALLRGIDDLLEDSNLGGWLVTVAKRHTWRFMKHDRRDDVLSSDSLKDSGLVDSVATLGREDADSIEHWELSYWLEGGLSRLDRDCRELLMDLYLRADTLSYKEVAARLDVPLGSVGPTRARCLKRLRRLLKGDREK